jgi:hypothetical protein
MAAKRRINRKNATPNKARLALERPFFMRLLRFLAANSIPESAGNFQFPIVKERRFSRRHYPI